MLKNCKRGHEWNSNTHKRCPQCAAASYAKWIKENPDKNAERIAKYYKENLERITERMAKYYKENSEKIIERMAKYRKENPDKIIKGQAKYRKENPEKIIERSAIYYKENLDKISTRQAKYYKENLKKIAEVQVKYRKENPEKISEYQAKYRKENPKRIAAKHERRAAAIKRQTPTWLTDAELAQMQRMWNNKPSTHAVDHIIPIQGVNVSGLNVPWNLQYLPKKQNLFKGRKFDFTNENESWKLEYIKHHGDLDE